MGRKKYTAKFKTKVVLEALKERETTKELSQRFQIHPQQINNWKRHFLSSAEELFLNSKQKKALVAEDENAQLLQMIGQLTVENDFLKKSIK